MQPCVNRFRLLCAEDLELRCGLVRRLETDRTFMEDVPEIPSDIAVACLLNPLVGGKSHSLSCGCCLVVAVLWLLSSWCLSCGCCRRVVVVVVAAVFANFVCTIAVIFQVKKD
jgi:hypothetical protein